MNDRPYIDSNLLQKAAREYGRIHGFSGNHGGWISNGHFTACQGWHSFALNYGRDIRDHFTRELTAFNSFHELVTTDERYCPTILPRTWREQFLADAFDVEMSRRRSSRRAWRGLTPTTQGALY